MRYLAGLPILILYFIFLVIVPVIITQKKRPEAALAWVLLAIFVPFNSGLQRVLVNRGHSALSPSTLSSGTNGSWPRGSVGVMC